MMARLGALATSFILGVGLVNVLSTAGSAADPSWTIMVYMADDFTSSLNWQDDLNEMEAAAQASSTNIIALVDPYGPSNSTIYKVLHDQNLIDGAIVSQVVDDQGAVISGGEVDMAASDTLRNFVVFTAQAFPADCYALILWGHGADWHGLCPDGSDLLTLPELRDALSQSTTTIGRPLDLIVVDSCAQASVEMLWQLHEFSRFFVGSEKDVPFQGLPYSLVMNDLYAEPDQSVSEFASRIVDDYVAWSATYTEYSVTMGVFDLSKLTLLMSALDELSVQGQKYDPIFHETLRAAFDSSERFERPYYMDFEHLMYRLQCSDLPLEIRYLAVECLAQSRVLIEHFGKHDNSNALDGVRVENATGMTIYAPGNGSADDAYANLTISASEWYAFGELLRNDTISVPNGQGPTVQISSSGLVPTGRPSVVLEDIATLTWPGGCGPVSVWVFRNNSGSLVLDSTFASVDSEIELRQIPGPLTLASSAFYNGALFSYRTINITLEAVVTIEVQVIRHGEIVSDLDTEYDIVLVASDGTKFDGRTPSETGRSDKCSFSLVVPLELKTGELVTIEVVSKSSHKLVGTGKTFVPSENATIMINDLGISCCPYKDVVPVLFALLPGFLIIGFALSLRFQHRRQKPKK